MHTTHAHTQVKYCLHWELIESLLLNYLRKCLKKLQLGLKYTTVNIETTLTTFLFFPFRYVDQNLYRINNFETNQGIVIIKSSINKWIKSHKQFLHVALLVVLHILEWLFSQHPPLTTHHSFVLLKFCRKSFTAFFNHSNLTAQRTC